MDKRIIAAIVVVLVIIIIVVAVVTMQASKKHAAVLASCAGLNIQLDQAGNSVLCPLNTTDRTWLTKGLGSYGINNAGSCPSSNDYKDCNRCISMTPGAPPPYQADPSIGLAAGWPNSRSDLDWPTYAGPVSDGQYVGNYAGHIAVTDPMPVPLACLG